MNKKYLIPVISVITALAVLIGGIGIYKQHQLNKTKETAKVQITETFDYKDYRAEQKKEIKTIISTATEKINKAKDIDSVNSTVEKTKKQIDAIKTDKELTEEEAAKALADAQKKAIENLKNVADKKDYREDEQNKLADIIKKYTKQIEKETDVNNINKIFDKAKKKIQELKTDAEYAEEEAAAAAAAEAARKQSSSSASSSKSNSNSSSHNNSNGCVGNDADNFY